jgi:hypothetical protein
MLISQSLWALGPPSGGFLGWTPSRRTAETAALTKRGGAMSNDIHKTASAIAAFLGTQLAFVALVKKGILSKAEAEEILRQAIEAINNRLHKCAFGEISLTMTQLRAIEILLRKCIPDLAAAEIKSEQTRRYVVEVPPVLDRDEWQRKYGQNPSLPPPSLQ